MSLRTRYLIFAGQAIACLIAISLLWHFFIATSYNRTLVAVTDSLSGDKIILGEDFDEEVRQELGLKEEYIYIADTQPWGLELHGYIDGLALHYGMLLVICLIAATPGITWRQRLKFIPLALLIMFIIHIITILIFAQVARSSTPASPINENPWVILFLIVGCDLFPALIWGVLSYKYWSSKLKAAPPRRGNPNNKGEIASRSL